jgi:hypothetical protein
VALSEPIIDADQCLLIHRFIICSNSFIAKVLSKCSRAGLYAVLAHEIAHHLNGDNFADTDFPEERRQTELNSDSFSGFLCYQLALKNKFPLDSFTRVFDVFGDSVDTDTHPNKKVRIQTFINGWDNAKKFIGLSCEAKYSFEINPQLAIAELSNNNQQYVTKMKSQFLAAIGSNSNEKLAQMKEMAISSQSDTTIINLRGDSSLILKDSNNTFINSRGAQLKTLNEIHYAKDFSSEGNSRKGYLVDTRNIIWAKYPNGVPYIAGYYRKGNDSKHKR